MKARQFGLKDNKWHSAYEAARLASELNPFDVEINIFSVLALWKQEKLGYFIVII